MRPFVLIIALAFITPTAAQAQGPPPDARIKPGVRAGGVDLSNLTILEATQRLTDTLTGPLAQNVVVRVAGRKYKLSPKGLKFVFDAERTAKRAFYAGENNPPDQSQAGGAAALLDVPLAVTYRRAVVRDFVAAIDREVYIAPRNATLTMTLKRMVRNKSREGRDLDGKGLRALVEQVLADPSKSRELRGTRAVVKPKVNALQLANQYGTVITIDRNSFKLRLFKRLQLSKSYGIAVGLPAYPTPTGRFSISNKQINPTWTAPNSPWAGELAGQSVSGGAWNNPLKARWMGVANGVGIHGTGQEWSIGSRASHGCIRMRVADVTDLYPRVPVGTPVLIK